MENDLLLTAVQFGERALRRNLEGLSDDDCLVQPPQGNCINWQLGHILAHRNVMLEMLGAARVWDPERQTRYARGSAPITKRDDSVEPLETLLAELARAEERLVDAIKETGAEALAEPSGSSTVGQRLSFLAMHEAYHVGQIALARRIVGREGAIR